MVYDRLKQTHGLVLSHVSKVHEIILKLLSGIVFDADINQVNLKNFGVLDKIKTIKIMLNEKKELDRTNACLMLSAKSLLQIN